MSLLCVRGISISFGGVRALQHVDAEVQEGQVLGIIGPNGSGKTTLFNVITGIYKPHEGQITFGGVDITGLPSYDIARVLISRTFQNIRLFASQTVLGNTLLGQHIRFHSSLLSVLARTASQRREEEQACSRSTELLALVGLQCDVHQPATSLPYGDERCLEIARALGSQPRLLLLDEPTAGMSASEAADIMALVRKIRDSGVTVALVEHNMRVMMGLADTIVVLDEGKKIAEGPPSAIQRNEAVIRAYLGEG